MSWVTQQAQSETCRERPQGKTQLFSVSTVSHWPAPIDTGAGFRDQRTLNTCHFSEKGVLFLDIHYKDSLNTNVVPISHGSTGGSNSGHNFSLWINSSLSFTDLTPPKTNYIDALEGRDGLFLTT